MLRLLRFSTTVNCALTVEISVTHLVTILMTSPYFYIVDADKNIFEDFKNDFTSTTGHSGRDCLFAAQLVLRAGISAAS